MIISFVISASDQLLAIHCLIKYVRVCWIEEVYTFSGYIKVEHSLQNQPEAVMAIMEQRCNLSGSTGKLSCIVISPSFLFAAQSTFMSLSNADVRLVHCEVIFYKQDSIYR